MWNYKESNWYFLLLWTLSSLIRIWENFLSLTEKNCCRKYYWYGQSSGISNQTCKLLHVCDISNGGKECFELQKCWNVHRIIYFCPTRANCNQLCIISVISQTRFLKFILSSVLFPICIVYSRFTRSDSEFLLNPWREGQESVTAWVENIELNETKYRVAIIRLTLHQACYLEIIFELKLFAFFISNKLKYCVSHFSSTPPSFSLYWGTSQ